MQAVALGLNAAAVEPDKFARNGQPQSESAMRARPLVLHLIEVVEDAVEVISREANARVTHRDTHGLVCLLGADSDVATRRRKGVGILQQMCQHNAQPLGVGGEFDGRVRRVDGNGVVALSFERR